MRVYLNEWDSFCAKWLQNLFPTADVDDRDLRTVGSGDVVPYDRVHLFAGIGGWEYALGLAGWPCDVPVWTGSCPCQPFSVAGKQKGTADERHLWPEMYRLIRECKPAVVFGEQVAGNAGLAWFDGVRLDLEKIDYAVGLAVLPASGVGAPHKRERIFWVADAAWTARERPLVRGDAQSRGRDISNITGWNNFRIMQCQDGERRRIPTEPSFQPLVNGVPNRLGDIKAYGNAIVPQLAALFIRAYMDVKGITPHLR